LLEFKFKASRGICSCCKGLCPLGSSFDLFIDHYFFVSFSFFKFIFVVFRLFDGVPIGNIFGFFFKHIQVDIYPFNSTFNLWAFKHGIRTPLRFIWPKGLNYWFFPINLSLFLCWHKAYPWEYSQSP
jgi:hypothetical protein